MGSLGKVCKTGGAAMPELEEENSINNIINFGEKKELATLNKTEIKEQLERTSEYVRTIVSENSEVLFGLLTALSSYTFLSGKLDN